LLSPDYFSKIALLPMKNSFWRLSPENPEFDFFPRKVHVRTMVFPLANPPLPASPKGKINPRNTFPRRIDAQAQAQIRTMYLVRGMTPKEIGVELGIPTDPIQSLVNRKNWTKLRSGRWAAQSKEVESLMQEEVKRTLQEAAFTSEELMIGAGELARKVLNDNDNKNQCRDLSSSAQAMRTFLEISKSCRGIGENTTSQAVDISFFVLPAAPKKEEKNVSPPVSQVPADKQITNPHKPFLIEIEKP
jgi:hypothetical protein